MFIYIQIYIHLFIHLLIIFYYINSETNIVYQYLRIFMSLHIITMIMSRVSGVGFRGKTMPSPKKSSKPSYTYIYIYIYMYMHVNVSIFIYVYTYIYIYIYMHNMYTYLCILKLHKYLYHEWVSRVGFKERTMPSPK